MSVLDFKAPEDDGPHLSGKARCIACEHEWVAESPVGTTWLECPSCRTIHGLRQGYCLPSDEKIWQCNCGCDVFYCSPRGVYCYLCGLEQVFS